MNHLLPPILTAALFIGLHAHDNTTLFVTTRSLECWTDWVDRDDASGTGDWETLNALRAEFPGKLCDNPSEIMAQTLDGVDFAATNQRAAAYDTERGFLCNNCDQDDDECKDYKIRLKCPTDFCVKPDCWTAWLDVDDPSGDGDRETLADLRAAYPGRICPQPQEIQAQDSTGVPLEALTVQPVLKAFDLTTGLICLNAEQLNSTVCDDFKVRFKCPADFCATPKCYTPWFDRDDPSGSGDWEITSNLVTENPGLICKKRLAIEAQTTEGLSVMSTKNVINRYDLSGFVCKAADQPKGITCHDYKIRFLCPADFCIKPECYTVWFNTTLSAVHNFSEFKRLYDSNPGKICDYPIKIEERVFRNNALTWFQVRFMCPSKFCNVVDHGHYVGSYIAL